MASSHLLKIHFNIVLPSTRSSSKKSLSLRYPDEKPVYTASPEVLRDNYYNKNNKNSSFKVWYFLAIVVTVVALYHLMQTILTSLFSC